jgi:hypothetical protein
MDVRPAGVETDATPQGALIAYALSACTTVLWVACVLPAGPLVADGVSGDLAAPLQRGPWLLVGALVLLVLGPVGVSLAGGRAGQLAVLGSTDAFVAAYVALGLTANRAAEGVVAVVLVCLLWTLAGLSAIETVRRARGARRALPAAWQGLRLALCLIVLVMPSWLLVHGGRELASLLAPFAFVAIGSAGASFARTAAGLRLTSAVLHFLLAVHLFVAIRYLVFDADPAIRAPGPAGWATLGLAGAVLLLTFLLLLRRAYRVRQAARALDVPGPAGP